MITPRLTVNTANKYHSQLFTLRLWIEQTGPDSNDIRIRVQHVLSGEVRYFRNWTDVAAFVMQVIQNPEIKRQTKKENP